MTSAALPEALETFDETSFAQEPYGPSSRSICRVSNRNSCGSGTLVGKRNGRSLVLTNAHVAGTRIGHTVRCYFPEIKREFTARVIMAGYSNRVMMDWCVLEVAAEVPLPHIKLANEVPSGEHYTGGYPRCRGPFYQKLRTTRITHNGTVWRWQPVSVGGQSGSGVHSFSDNLQYGLLTWSWGGDGAGQTCRSIWLQYANRAEIGFARPAGLVELSETAEDLEEGFFAEADITTLPIWDHLDDGDDDDDGGNIDPEPCPAFAKKVLEQAKAMQKEAGKLAELARKYGDCDDCEDGEGKGPDTIFGL